MSLTNLTLKAAIDGLAAREFTSVELTRAHIEAIEAARGLNAYILETPDKAIDMAAKSDARRALGEAGPLEGAPLGVKDLFCTNGVRTTACSKILENFVPTYESTVTSQLWRDGAVMLGKLNLDQFAMGSSNETSYFGPVTNPWRAQGSTKALTPGGSSGGSAAAVAADLCLGATATDTGGSIRQPAAFTGTVGIKPTYGRCSRWGVVAFASSLDQAGPIAKTVEDAALLLTSMSGHDPKDSTSLDIPVPDFTQFVGKSVKGLKIGIPKEYRVDNMPAEIEKLWQDGIAWLKEAGCEIVDISLPHTKYALPAYYIVAPAEASSNLARYDGMRYGLREEGANLTEIDLSAPSRSACASVGRHGRGAADPLQRLRRRRALRAGSAASLRPGSVAKLPRRVAQGPLLFLFGLRERLSAAARRTPGLHAPATGRRLPEPPSPPRRSDSRSAGP